MSKREKERERDGNRGRRGKKKQLKHEYEILQTRSIMKEKYLT